MNFKLHEDRLRYHIENQFFRDLELFGEGSSMISYLMPKCLWHHIKNQCSIIIELLDESSSMVLYLTIAVELWEWLLFIYIYNCYRKMLYEKQFCTFFMKGNHCFCLFYFSLSIISAFSLSLHIIFFCSPIHNIRLVSSTFLFQLFLLSLSFYK